MKFIIILIIILSILYFSYIIFERIYHHKLRRKFKYVIHVNGIRGKSTVTRLIDAGLRECGFNVFSKTTGTVPTMINVNNEDVKVIRHGNSNIREQLKMIRYATKQNAQVLVLECMAVNPELQKICEEKILNADVTVITNVRPDHILDMGENLDDIAKAFSNTIPTSGKLVITNDQYKDFFIQKAKAKNSLVVVVDKWDKDETLDTFGDNISVALGVAEALNLDKKVFFEGMKKYHHDIGAFEKYKIGNTVFLNGLSINDPYSIKFVYEELVKTYECENMTILLNSRGDRPSRTLQHINLMKDLKCKKIILTGANLKYIKKKIEALHLDVDVEILSNVDSLLEEKLIFAIGNIGGKGMEILEYFKCNGGKL